MSLRAVLLDVGGTLLAEVRPRASLYAEAARECGLDTSDERMAERMSHAHEHLPRIWHGHYRYSTGWFRAFIGLIFTDLGCPPALVRQIEDSLLARFADPTTFRLHEGALELLEALRARGLGLGVVSNWSEALPGLLEGLGVAERVDFVVCSALEGCEKPEPEIFRRALALAGVLPGEAVHAGNDPVRDVQAARAVGILPVLVRHGAPPTLRGPLEENPVEQVGSLGELAAWILERTG